MTNAKSPSGQFFSRIETMKKVISIYAAGGIQKGELDKGKVCWSKAEFDAITQELTPIEVVFLKPDERGDDIANAFTVFGRDHYQVSVADFVVVDLRQKRGIGVGIEMLSAKYYKKPLIAVAPRNDHYRKDYLEYLGGNVTDYVHAHLASVADAIVDDFPKAGEWIKEFLKNPKPVKGISILEDAIGQYKETQFKADLPMQEALKKIGK